MAKQLHGGEKRLFSRIPDIFSVDNPLQNAKINGFIYCVVLTSGYPRNILSVTCKNPELKGQALSQPLKGAFSF